MGADRFITNNQRDFPATITEIQVTCPADLPGTTDADTSTVTHAKAAARKVKR
jgi:hypothetical protein